IGVALAAAGFKASSSVADDILGAFSAPEMATPVVEPAALAAPMQRYSVPSYNWGQQDRAPLNYDRNPGQLRGFTEPSGRVETVEIAPEAVDYPLGTARAQMFDNYIIAQNENGLLLVDQHAAHERLVYERFKAQMTSGPVASQAQLIPVIVELPEEDCGRLEEAAPELEKFGLYLDRFGPRAIAVRETPALLGTSDIKGLINDLADGLAEWDSAA